MQIGPIVITTAARFPLIQKAHKLARAMTLAEIEDVLEGRVHLHRNPKRKPVAVEGLFDGEGVEG